MADYIIVGAGVFGVSTALHLASSEPDATIYLVDRTPCPCPSAAASDLNKIVRADYDDIFYMRLALEALHEWNTNRLYKPFFHETGMLFAEEKGVGNTVFHNYKKLGINPGAQILTPAQALERFPVFRNANWTGVKDNYYNPRSGWGEADPAARAVIRAALDAGVTYIQQTVARLIFRRARSVNGRMVAAAATSCIVQCDPDYLHLYRDAPVHFLGMSHTHGESIPPTIEGKLKFNFEVSFTNKEYHEASGQTISVPPVRSSQSTWGHDVPEELKGKVMKVVEHVYGKDAPGLAVESYRMCWDAVTPNQDWVISPHPACKGLYIAGGGSFHAWKFLPIIGKYVTQMLKGQLIAEQAQRWAWDRNDEGAACIMYIPHNDLKDFA
ncbi:hypothetical protein O1611_g5837 [Lasiodiplodia mahajangana]|uniref:Uncharacterized protein n=1 Tax=Lasiodiplodia mahajangana TaxID=1108764 RepID=A0ACC2JKP9_9PEZI|nr:hypothetical protein O1611_g5837 [Lasiodiplodia mahajangana]